jgi:hypothetical protein
MLNKKKDALNSAKDKYEMGVIKLNETSTMVAELEATLKVSSIEVEKIKKMADAQAQTVGAEKEIVDARLIRLTPSQPSAQLSLKVLPPRWRPCKPTSTSPCQPSREQKRLSLVLTLRTSKC